MDKFCFGKDKLTINICIDIALGHVSGILVEGVTERIQNSRAIVEKLASSDSAIYGVNTGFGPLCETKISPKQTSQLQENLLLSHAVGVGESISPLISKIMLICKVHALSQGYSGISLPVLERIKYFIDHDIIPVIPSQGSVGASGDLAPLAHAFLPLIGEGRLWSDGVAQSTAEVYSKLNLEPLKLSAKEGLALINGTQFILAHSIYGLYKTNYLLDLADVAGVMSLEGLQGSKSPFLEKVHRLRPFPGTLLVAERINQFLQNSENLDAHVDCDRVQDPYSIRCMPQVHGASRNALSHLEELTTIELNSVTDNPIIFNDGDAISAGNFHGQPLAMALDYASIAVSELGNISDRRCYLLLEGKYGLPPMLVSDSGLNSGYMIPQYTTAALVTENKSLCFPASADSIPTSMGQEDHVSMGSISSRKFNQIIENLEKILAIELMYAVQAMELRRPLSFSPILENNFKLVRSKVAKLEKDRLLKTDIDEMISLVKARAFEVNI